MHRLITGDGLGGAEGGEDGIGETSSQQSQTGGLVLAPGLLFGQIGMAGADATGLGDSDHVESTVGRSVAAAVETDLARAGAGPHRNRCSTGEPGIGILVAEAVNAANKD